MNNLTQILNKLPDNISRPVMDLPADVLDNLEEIRIKAYGDIRILSKGREIVVALKNQGLVTKEDLDEILNQLLNYSYYAYEEELAKGYITIEGGHRVGVCGRTVLDKGNVTLIKEISSLNLRRSREIKGVADSVIPHIFDADAMRVKNTLIVSPPKCGKTTLLRDIIRILSYRGCKIGLCDERSELAGSYLGKPSYDLGPRTDVMDGCPKAEGMTMLIRAMSPDVIVTDEIGKPEDIDAILSAICAGVSIVTTIHGSDYKDIENSNIGPLVSKGIFSKLIFLSNNPSTGTISEIANA